MNDVAVEQPPPCVYRASISVDGGFSRPRLPRPWLNRPQPITASGSRPAERLPDVPACHAGAGENDPVSDPENRAEPWPEIVGRHQHHDDGGDESASDDPHHWRELHACAAFRRLEEPDDRSCRESDQPRHAEEHDDGEPAGWTGCDVMEEEV